MATGPEHYRQAESLIHDSQDPKMSAELRATYLQEAQVQATLALAAATALREVSADLQAWRKAASAVEQ